MYLGIDLGTSSVKIILTNKQGIIINEVTKDYPVNYLENGWVEQNPSDWYNMTLLALKEIINDLKVKEISAISFSGQMHGLVVLDQFDQVIRPCILWNDTRTSEETDYLNKVIGKDKLISYTGNIAFCGFTAPKILWLKKHEPENFKKIAKIMLPKDYLVYKFTNHFVTDYSDASGTLLLDVKNKKWSKEMLDICGIKLVNLPTIYESYEEVGRLNQNLANQLGLNNEPKIIVGAADNAASAIGTKTFGQNGANISIGTSGTIFLTSDHFVTDENHSLHAFCHADGKWYLMGCILSAASAFDWWAKKIIKMKVDEAQGSIKAEKLGQNEVLFLPYLVGERCPYNDARARGVFFGLSQSTTESEMTEAVLEGVAFAIRDCYECALKEGIRPVKSRICGGGANSSLWITIMANVLNIQLEVLSTNNGASLGAAILAMVGDGAYESINDATASIVKVDKVITPDPKLVEKYNERYQKYKKLYPALKNLY